MAKGITTQQDLAKIIGVSYLTVSRALNNSPLVRPKTRDRVLAACRQLGYRKNMVAKSLSMRKTNSIGMVVSNPPYSFWAEIIGTVERRARELNYQVVVCHRTPDESSEREVDFLLERQVDGLIVAPDGPFEKIETFRSVADSGTPLLLFNDFILGVQGNYLGSNSREGARKGCQYLIGLGHRRICFMASRKGYYAGDCRLEGYLTAMRSANLDTEGLVIHAEGWGEEHGEQAAQRILEMSPRPTAIFAANDPLVIGVYMVMRQAGIRIPEDMSILGYAGMWEGKLLNPPLTSIAQPIQNLGRRAMDLMIELIEKKHERPVFEEMEDELLIRQSCSSPSGLRPS